MIYATFFLKGKNQKRFSPDEFKFIKNTLSGDLNCQGSIMDSQLKEAKTDTWTVSENGHITSVREIHFPKRAHLPESRVSDSGTSQVPGACVSEDFVA